MEDALEKKIESRPEAKSLEQLNILKDQQVAPSLQQAKADLEKAKLSDSLEKGLNQRPPADDATVKKVTGHAQ